VSAASDTRARSRTFPGSLADQLVCDLIEDSYDLVVSAFPERVRRELGWASDTDET